FGVVERVVGVNERQKARMVAKVKDALGGLSGRKIAVLGLTFKPNTDDIREAPALDILAGFIRGGASVTAYDPVGMPRVRALPVGRKIAYADAAYAALKGADAPLLVTQWNDSRPLDL